MDDAEVCLCPSARRMPSSTPERDRQEGKYHPSPVRARAIRLPAQTPRIKAATRERRTTKDEGAVRKPPATRMRHQSKLETQSALFFSPAPVVMVAKSVGRPVTAGDGIHSPTANRPCLLSNSDLPA